MFVLMSEKLFSKWQSYFYYNKEKFEITGKTNCELHNVNTSLVSLEKIKFETVRDSGQNKKPALSVYTCAHACHTSTLLLLWLIVPEYNIYHTTISSLKHCSINKS